MEDPNLDKLIHELGESTQDASLHAVMSRGQVPIGSWGMSLLSVTVPLIISSQGQELAIPKPATFVPPNEGMETYLARPKMRGKAMNLRNPQVERLRT